MTTINLRKRVIYTFKSDIDEDILVSNVNHTYLQKSLISGLISIVIAMYNL